MSFLDGRKMVVLMLVNASQIVSSLSPGGHETEAVHCSGVGDVQEQHDSTMQMRTTGKYTRPVQHLIFTPAYLQHML